MAWQDDTWNMRHTKINLGSKVRSNMWMHNEHAYQHDDENDYTTVI